MSKTVTLRISEDHHALLKAYAKSENRKLSNAVETLVLKQLDEETFVDRYKMEGLLTDKNLLARLRAGHHQAKKNRGRFVD